MSHFHATNNATNNLTRTDGSHLLVHDGSIRTNDPKVVPDSTAKSMGRCLHHQTGPGRCPYRLNLTKEGCCYFNHSNYFILRNFSSRIAELAPP